MSTEVRVSYDWTIDEIRRATRIGSLVNSSVAKSRIIFFVYGVMVAFAVWPAWHSQDINDWGIVIVLLLMPMLIWLLLGRVSSLRAVNDPNLNHPVQITISSDRWLVESHTSRTEFQWSPVKAITRMGEGFVVNFHDRMFRWLPIHGFESDVAVETFVRMVESHDVNYDDRRLA